MGVQCRLIDNVDYDVVNLSFHAHMRCAIKDAVDYYSVVLLTDDRNLRVKALANSLPVRDLPEFMKLLTHST